MSLADIISNLKAKEQVTAVFLTGSEANTGSTDHSDYDLVVILASNEVKIKSIYTFIDSKFADIFFFTEKDIKELAEETEVNPNSMNGILLNWLDKAKVEFDKTGSISELQNKIKHGHFKIVIPEDEVTSILNKVNYNFICNQRYYQSQDDLYLKALDIKLLYSVVELVTAYFTFRQMPWRGEKQAISYIEANDPAFYRQFQNFLASKDIDERMRFYGKLFNIALPESLNRWDNSIVIGEPHDGSSEGRERAKIFWQELIRAS
jgi:predicted nucleotidyltransferase